MSADGKGRKKAGLPLINTDDADRNKKGFNKKGSPRKGSTMDKHRER